MNYMIDRGAKLPAYLQLYRQVRANILEGALPFRAKLPSKRTMAEETGVSTVTVENAYGLLCAEGYIETRERSGYYVIFRADDGFAAAESMPVPPAEAAAEAPSPQFPFSVIAKTMRRVLGERGERVLQKSPNAGCAELRETLARYLARNRGIRADADQIVIGSGAEYLYGLIAGLLGRDKRYAIESPSYEKIEMVYRAAGIRCDLLPLARDGVDSAALANTRADVLHVTPYRSYPTGITATASKRHEYIRWADKGGRVVIEDDFESEFSVAGKPAETLFSLSDRGNVIYVNTFSRTVSPSFRVGYMVLPTRLVPVFREKLGFYSCFVPTFEQYVLESLIRNGDFERHINRVRRQKRREMSETP